MGYTQDLCRTLKAHILSSLIFCQFLASAAKVGLLDLFQAQPRRILEQPHPSLRSNVLGLQMVNLTVYEI